ncbi:MAG TPA: hypothetical protein VFX59_31115 [Polyangiales bacterium]|nr:hypothetical protein [Polyangiales bacterium]
MNVIRQSLLIALLSVFASVAQARDLAHDLHLSLDTALFDWSKSSIDGFDPDFSNVRFGFPNTLGARVGFLPLDALELGLRVSFNYARSKADGSKITGSNEGVFVYARYVAPGSGVRVFAGPFLGGNFAKSKSKGDLTGGTDYVAKTRGFAVGAEVGVYGFLTESFSIDPSLAFTYAGSWYEAEGRGGDGLDERSVTLSLNVAFSGWLAL